MDFSKIDKNFEVKTTIDKEDIRFFNVDEEPFKVYGIFRENGKYRRMPEAVAKSVSEGVYALHANTAGGRVRFVTDSPYVAIHAKMENVERFPHFPLTGSAGFDVYSDGEPVKTFFPPVDVTDGYEGVFDFPDTKEREITINFPLYSNVIELYIGLQENSSVKEATPYVNTLPVVYYGSSITQGGCASKPGMSYQEIVSRKLNLDYVNLGFSGSALAEEEIIEYIKGLDMAAFVYDYDHNAPTVQHLKNTHNKMFEAIRSAQPDLPIIMMNRPNYILKSGEMQRKDIIQDTYNNAVAKGDKNVYFIDNEKLCKLCGNNGLVDNCHPSDFGFYSMAEAVSEVMEKIQIGN